jgi:molecular chaperone GrpE
VLEESVSESNAHDIGVPADEAAADGAAADGAAAADPDGLAVRVEQLAGAVAALHREVVADGERAAARERVIDRQYQDIERLRLGERQALLRPMLVELRRLRDDLLRQAAALPEKLPASQVVTLLESFAYSAELILSRAGVEVLRPVVGTPFDPSRQRAAGVLPAPSPELDGTVAEVLGDGYLDLAGDRVLATATVRVQRWQEPARPPAGGVPANQPAAT